MTLRSRLIRATKALGLGRVDVALDELLEALAILDAGDPILPDFRSIYDPEVKP